MLWLRVPEKLYFKKGGTSVALKELRDEYHCKKAFIITDATLFELGVCQPVVDQLESMGIEDGDIVSLYDWEFEYQS